ncbi:MAG TPA: M48 family metallopeptidase [Candidatus Paceibacterota bacterium]
MVTNLYTHQSENVRKTFLLMGGFLVFVITLGWVFSQALSNPAILYIAVVIAIVMNLVSYWSSDKVAIALSGARWVARQEAVELYRAVENLSITAGLQLPKIHIIPSPQINALATGRDAKHAAVAVTTGALEKLSGVELEGVLAHELSHIGNKDMLVSTVVVVLAGVVALLSDFFLRSLWWGGGGRDNNRGGGAFVIFALAAAILAPIAATLIRLAVSREREFLADASGVMLTRYPEGLAGALEKIAKDKSPMSQARSGLAHLYFTNPYKNSGKLITKLFMTHPPLEERIRRLRATDNMVQ